MRLSGLEANSLNQRRVIADNGRASREAAASGPTSDKKKLLPPRPPQSTAGAVTASLLQGCAPPTLAVQHDKGTRGEYTRDSTPLSATQHASAHPSRLPRPDIPDPHATSCPHRQL